MSPPTIAGWASTHGDERGPLDAPTSGEPCGSVESYHGCPVTSRLAAALARFASGGGAEPLCRCQNTFDATFRNGPALPSAYKGSRKDKVATANLQFGAERVEMFVIVHNSSDGSSTATDTYCAAEAGDRHPFRNRMTGSDPQPCAVLS